MDKANNYDNPLGFIPRALEPWNEFEKYCSEVGIKNRKGQPYTKGHLRKVLIYRMHINPAICFAAKEFAAVWRVKIAELEGVL